MYWVVKWEGVWKRYETRGSMGWDLSFTVGEFRIGGTLWGGRLLPCRDELG